MLLSTSSPPLAAFDVRACCKQAQGPAASRYSPSFRELRYQAVLRMMSWRLHNRHLDLAGLVRQAGVEPQLAMYCALEPIGGGGWDAPPDHEASRLTGAVAGARTNERAGARQAPGGRRADRAPLRQDVAGDGHPGPGGARSLRRLRFASGFQAAALDVHG